MISFTHKEFSVRTKLTSKLMFTDILRRKNFLMTKKIKKKQNAHLSVSGTVPKTQWVTPLRLVSLDCLRQYFFEIFYVFFSNSCIWKMPYFRNLFITKISFFLFWKNEMCKWALANFWNCGTQFFTCWTASPRTG